MFPITAEEGKNRFEYAIINENHVVMHYSDGFFDLAGVDTTKDLSKHLPIFANGLERLEKTKKPLRLNQQDPFLHYTLEPFVHRDEELFFVTLTNSEYVRALHKNIDLLAEQSFLMKSILDSLHDGIFIVDAKGKIVYFNDAITRLSGYEKSTMIGSNVFEGLQHGDYKNSCVAKVLQTKVPYVTINEYSQWGVKKGESKGNDCLVSGTPIFDRQKNLKYAVSIARDISELQQIQEELQKTKTLSMIYNRQIKSFQQQTRVEIAETRSKIIENLFELANQVADIDLPILLVGETGVGKDFFANYIHAIGAKSASPFLKINCSAIPDTLLESELFGYEAGAFTGASKEGKQGLFEISGDGSLFLDEVGDMPYLLQAKLLGVLQDKTIMPLGGNKEIKIKSRIIAATNANLEELIKQKKFRLDLFYRLNVIQFKIPPLRERKEDIIFFANKFLRDFNNKHNKNVYFSSDLYDKMLFYPWPGNIRELKNTVERIVVMSKNGSINKELLLSAGLGTGGAMPTGASASGDLSESPDLLGKMSLKEAVARYEADVIAAVMRQTDSVAEAAMRLGIDVSTLLRKRKKTKRLSASKKGTS